MAHTHEILTFQVGHYSNFVGAHWWNIQESSFSFDPSQADCQPVNHDVLFREGKNIKGEITFTPRLIAIDLKGSLKTLPEEGTLYATSTQPTYPTKWPAGLDIKTSKAEAKNEFLQDLEKQEKALYSDNEDDLPMETEQSAPELSSYFPKKFDLDEQVEVWSDFLRTRLHPRSIFQLNEYHHDNYSEQFDVFACGTEVSKQDTNREAIEDKIRLFVEECDYFQGFQMLLDGYNGFAGVSANILLHLEEEYSQKSKICYPLYQPLYKIQRPGDEQTEEAHRLLSTIFCLENLSTASSFFSPLGLGKQSLFQAQQDTANFDHVIYKPYLPYHTSAILGAALETLTLPTRLKVEPTLQSELAQQITYGNRKLISSSLCLPLPLTLPLSNSFEKNFSNGLKLTSLTPLSYSTNALVQSVIYSGIPKQAFGPQNQGMSNKAVEELLAKYVVTSYPCSALFLKNVHPPCKVGAPFPHIFQNNVAGNGLIQSASRHELLGVLSVPVVAAYRNSNANSQPIENLLTKAKKTNFRKYHRCLEMGVEMDDIKEVLHNLEGFADNYGDSGFLTEG